MKLYKIIIVFIGVLMVSCGQKLADLNIDPDASTSGGTGTAVFTAATGEYAIAMDGYFNETDALLAQYWAGGPGVALTDAERYFYTPSVFNTEWSYSYLQALSDLDYAKRNGNAGLSAISEVFSVAIYQNLVDHFGDIPYFEALNGDPEDGGILAPKYDDAKTIYDDLIVRLDAALDILENVDGSLSTLDLQIGAEDLIYGGVLNNWIKFAYSLKLRILMRQSVADPSVGQAVVDLISSGDFIDGSTSMVEVPFQGAAGLNQNPQFVRRTAGVGQFYVASETSTDMLTTLADPRGLVIYFPAATTGTLVGLPQGFINNVQGAKAADYSFPSSVAYGQSNSVIIMSSWEVYFLRAEAALRFATGENATAMYNSAISEHFAYVGAGSSGTYTSSALVDLDQVSTTQEKLDRIAVQKWISMNGLQESEGWIETRRFDNPNSRLFTDPNTGIFQTPTNTVIGQGVFPSIHLYPQTELDFNPNAPRGRAITDKVFWDN